MPVMAGKCVLFKAFGGVDAFPLCVKTKNVDEFVNTVYLLSGSFGGVNLENIAAPRCFEIEKKLKQRCDIPIFHDDQHGTAIVVAAALINALKVTGKQIGDIHAVFSGADLFVGISAPNLVTADMVKSMAPRPIIFPMANPTPEIMPDVALAAAIFPTRSTTCWPSPAYSVGPSMCVPPKSTRR